MRGRKNLAIIADFAAILGVSIVGFIGTPMVEVLLGRKFNLFRIVNGVLFYFVVVGVIILVSIVLLRKSWSRIREQNILVLHSSSLSIFSRFQSWPAHLGH